MRTVHCPVTLTTTTWSEKLTRIILINFTKHTAKST